MLRLSINDWLVLKIIERDWVINLYGTYTFNTGNIDLIKYNETRKNSKCSFLIHNAKL